MEPLAFRLRGEFVNYDPNEWRDQYDMTINVGLGTGDKQQQIAFFQNLMQTQMGLAQSPFGQLMIQPQNIYNTVAKLVELGGQKNVGDFVGDPQGRPLQPPGPPPQLAMEQAKMQQQMQSKQMELQQKAQSDEMDRRMQAELEMIRQKAQQQTDASRQAMEAQMHRMKLEQEAQIDALRAQYEDQRHQREIVFQQWKAELDASVKVTTTNMGRQMPIVDPATVAAQGEISREVQP
jgi:preprotein translocase subunit SecD